VSKVTESKMTESQRSKREFLKTAAYVVPSILTLKAVPAFAGSGSGKVKWGNRRRERHRRRRWDDD
jgi:hypothetical protein